MRRIVRRVLLIYAISAPFFLYPLLFVGAVQLSRGPHSPPGPQVGQYGAQRRSAVAAGATKKTPSWPADSPQSFSRRASEHLRGGQVDLAIRRFRDAMKHNPRDLGDSYRFESPAALPAAAVEHGQRQVRRMLRDRPTMAQFTSEGDFLWNWAARQFAGEQLREVIEWDPVAPRHSPYAEHSGPTKSKRGRIRAARRSHFGAAAGGERSFEELWSNVVFELHNIAHSAEFKRVHQSAQRGELTRAEYVYGIFRIEFEAMQTTRAFYVYQFLPWSKSQDLRSRPDHWYTGDFWWGTAANCFVRYRRADVYPWSPYGSYFDFMQIKRNALLSATGATERMSLARR